MGQGEFSIFVQKEDEENQEKIKVVNNQTIFVGKYILAYFYNLKTNNFLLYHEDTLLDESKPVSFYGLKRGDIITLKF